jgi:DNA-3-methyladenine glycosylase
VPALDPLPRDFYRRSAEVVARSLLGRWIVRDLAVPGGTERLVLRIVETEAYLGEGDRASHAHAGPATPRARRLFQEPGLAYVYLIYGMHHCLNAVTGSADDGSAVLIRAGEPLEGAEHMLRLRGWHQPARAGDVAGGPGKLCQAMAIDRAFDGLPLWKGSLRLNEGERVADAEIVRGRRVGVDYAGEAASWPLRFALRGNAHVSRPGVERTPG